MLNFISPTKSSQIWTRSPIPQYSLNIMKLVNLLLVVHIKTIHLLKAPQCSVYQIPRHYFKSYKTSAEPTIVFQWQTKSSCHKTYQWLFSKLQLSFTSLLLCLPLHCAAFDTKPVWRIIWDIWMLHPAFWFSPVCSFVFLCVVWFLAGYQCCFAKAPSQAPFSCQCLWMFWCMILSLYHCFWFRSVLTPILCFFLHYTHYLSLLLCRGNCIESHPIPWFPWFSRRCTLLPSPQQLKEMIRPWMWTSLHP